MQLAAEQTLRDGLKTLESRSAKARPGEHPEGAIVTIEPQTGYVRAIVGGYDFFRSEFNRAVQAKRQPGSAFKPFVYMAALEAGFTPATRIEDTPVSYAVGPNGQTWKPENYDRRFRGLTTLQQGIEDSVNVVTVKLQEQVGVNRTIHVARRFGIRSPLTPNLSLALGTSDLSLLELTSAYGALPNQGVWMPPTVIRYATDAKGKLLEENVPHGREAIPSDIAYVVTHMLRGVVERGTGQVAKSLGRPVAAKTGTTNDYSNAWFVGYTPRLVTGVWVGYDRPRSLGRDETGGRLAAPIWTSYMTRILGDTPKEDFPVPDRVVIVSVDLDPSNECIRPVPMAFVKGTEPATSCGARRQMTPLVPSPAPPSTLVPPPSAAAPREVAATSPAAGSSADRRSEGPSPQGP
jgi:penicillin-binding protein 1A